MKSILLYLFVLRKQEKITEEVLEQAIDAVSSLTVRARLCRTKGMNRQFSGAVMARLERITDYSTFIDDFWRAIVSGKGTYAFPSDEDFKDALIHKDLYQTLRGKGTKYLLYMMETHTKFHKELPPFDDSAITVEHIMPQTLSGQWKKYLDAETLENYGALLHRLGNLALTSYNSELHNETFDKKKQIYAESGFHYTALLAQCDEWSEKTINSRSEELAEEALKVWPFPEEYREGMLAVNHNSIHSLDEDFSQFTFTKPSLLIIGEDQEIAVSMWIEFFRQLCKWMNEENHDVFTQIAVPEKFAAFVRDEDGHCASDHAFVHIAGNIYVHGMSAYSILSTSAKVVKAFDQMNGSDYVNNISFIIK